MGWIDKSLSWLISGLFWVFLAVTLVFVIYTAFFPTPTEWGIVTGELQRGDKDNYVAVPNATSFPNNFSVENLTKAVIRHLAVFPEHINDRSIDRSIAARPSVKPNSSEWCSVISKTNSTQDSNFS